MSDPAARPRTPAALAIESQVVATDRGLAECGSWAFEHRGIVTLCRDAVSVAEIAARLGLRPNVARVLVGDLSTSGHVTAHPPSFDAARDVPTLRRVIHGLRALS
ncbi:DUF742 domain-containing protein [Kitasatospora sp. NPDC094015]|uniref:DUF742 domain-containing protein n=1 Tax=Kitasatospora sp. NPDC094015 TaxID=3155205 RepID=UPI003317F187